MPEERLAIAVASAFALALSILAIGWRPWRRESTSLGPGRVVTAIALVGGALLAASLNRRALPTWPPRGGEQTLWWALAGTLPLAWIESKASAPGRRALAVFLWSALAAALVWRTVPAVQAGHGWSDSQLRGILAGAVALLVLQRLATGDAVARLGGGAVVAFAYAAALAATGFALAQTGSLGQAAIGLGGWVACGAVFLLGMWRRDLPLLDGSAGVLALLHGGLLLTGLLYVPGFKLPLAGLLLLAPQLARLPIGTPPSWTALVGQWHQAPIGPDAA